MTTVTSYNKAYIDDALDSLTFLTCSRKTADYTLVLADAGKCIEMNVAGENALTIPANASVAFEIGTVIYVVQYGAGQTTILPGGSVTARSANSSLTLASQYSVVKLHKIGTNEWYVSGDLMPLLTCNRQTDDYILTIADANKCVEMNKATANNLTVPADADVPFEIGTVIHIAQYGAGQTTIVPDTGVDVRSLSGYLDIAGQYAKATLHKIAADEWYLSGDLVA